MLVALTTSETSSLIAAVSGLVGVVVGAVTTGAVEWWRARRDDKDQDRAGSRLVRADLSRAIDRIEWAIREGQWNAYEDPKIETWPMYRDRIAIALKDPIAWNEVETACSKLQRFSDLIRAAGDNMSSTTLNDDSLRYLELTRGACIRAHNALNGLAGDPTGAIEPSDPPERRSEQPSSL